jgi:hypothetical protein
VTEYDTALDELSADVWEEGDAGADAVGDESDSLLYHVGVDDWAAGETLAERNARILKRNDADRQAARPGDEIKPHRPAAFDANDAAALRLFFRRGAEAAGLTFGQLVRTMPPGRPSETDKRRRDVLARLVAQARDERQAKVETIAQVIGRPIVTVHQLASDGRTIATAD